MREVRGGLHRVSLMIERMGCGLGGVLALRAILPDQDIFVKRPWTRFWVLKARAVFKANAIPNSRQKLRRLQSPLAQEIRRVPSRSAQKRGGKRRYQGSRYQQSDRQAHPSQPSAQATSSDLSCSWTCRFF